MGKKLTKIQKKEIVRLEVANIISQASSEIFDDCDITQEEKKELYNEVCLVGLNKVRPEEPSYFGTGVDIVEYVRGKF